MKTTNRELRTIAPALVLAALYACGGTRPIIEAPTDLETALVAGSAEVIVDIGLNVDTESFVVDGIDVIHKTTPGNAIVHVTVFFDGGALAWERDRAGAEQLALSVVTHAGPASMTKAEYRAALDAMGSSISGSSGYDYATLSVSSIAQWIDETWEVFAAVVVDPAFRDDDIAHERELQLTSIRTETDDPDSAVSKLAKEILFADHPYAARPLGFEDTVESFTTDDLRGAFARLLDRSRMTVVVVGEIDRGQVEAMVRSAFGHLPEAGERSAWDPPPLVHASEPRVEIEVRAEIPTNYILGYFAAPAFTHEDYPATQIALEILSDRLFEEVRTRRNLSYAVASGLGIRRTNSGYVYVTATDPNTTLQVMLETIDRLIDEPVSEQDLRDQIEGYLTRYYVGLQRNSALAGALGTWTLLGGGRENADLHVTRLGAVTPEDVSRVTETYVRNIQIAVIGHPDQIDHELFTSR